MSNIYDDADDSNNEQEDRNSPKSLRDALKKAQSELKALNKAFEAEKQARAELDSKVKEQSLGDLLREKGVPDKVSKWLKRDNVEGTAEAVDAWLAENGADFGWNPDAKVEADAAPEDSYLSDEDEASMLRLQGIDEHSVAPTNTSSALNKIAALDKQELTFDELAAALKDIQGAR